MHTRLQGGRGQARRERAHRAVLGGEGLGQPGHVAAEAGRAFDQVYLDAGAGELLGGRHAGDAAAHHERRAMQERARARQVGLVARPGDGGLDDRARLLLGQCRLVAVDERAALAHVGEGHGVLAQAQVARGALERRTLKSRRAGRDDQVIEPPVLDRRGDELVALRAAHELVDDDVHDAVERAGVSGESVEVEDRRDVAAALAEKDAGPHRPPPPPALGFRRAPMRSSRGSTSWECEETPQSRSGSAPSASARSCCTWRWTKG